MVLVSVYSCIEKEKMRRNGQSHSVTLRSRRQRRRTLLIARGEQDRSGQG